jgi:membrane associated rhomboid family serine protease
MDHTSDRQLAHSLLTKLKGITTITTIVMGVLAASIANQGLFDAFFADQTLTTLAFDLEDPSRNWGTTWISSLFVHDGFDHFTANALWFLAFGLWIEHQKGIKTLALVSFAGHWISLMTALALYQGNAALGVPAKAHLVLGASSATLAMIGYAVCAMRNIYLMLFGLAIALIMLWDANSSAATHLVAMAAGIAIAAFSQRRENTKSNT